MPIESTSTASGRTREELEAELDRLADETLGQLLDDEDFEVVSLILFASQRQRFETMDALLEALNEEGAEAELLQAAFCEFQTLLAYKILADASTKLYAPTGHLPSTYDRLVREERPPLEQRIPGAQLPPSGSALEQ